MASDLVRNVSDTARWVATYRARESRRNDALFHDPLAQRLAGERGQAIAEAAWRHSQWALIARTKVIDDWIHSVVAEGSDNVLNLAAGFDTRPYRLPLPAALRWIEADLPALISEKEALLAGETPRCRLERAAVDLSDPTTRQRFLEQYTLGSQRVTVVTEGLVHYLDAAVVADLARDFLAVPAICTWILDFNSPRIRDDLAKRMQQTHANAPFKFAPPDGVAFFEKLGWKAREIRSLFHEAARLKRLPLWMRPFALFPAPDARHLGRERWSGVVRLERS